MRTIGLDLDGVLYRWHESLYEYFRLYRNFRGTYNEFWSTYIQQVSEEELCYLAGIDTLYSNMPPTRDCIDFLDVLKDLFEIFYVTSRPDSVRATTELFLEKHKFPFKENLIFTPNKDNFARLHKFSFAVDDVQQHLEKYSKVTTPILFAQPWNRAIRDNFIVVRNLMEIVPIVKGETTYGFE